MSSPRIPLATYRLQFNRDFTFVQAAELVPYLAALGISHCYASPYLKARPGSTHGYDIIDHNTLNPEIGSREDLERFVSALHENGMGQIIDLVPNHMGVMGSDNVWWMDVLENGQASNYADFFDIDWQPLKDELEGKMLVPVLGDQYGTVLDRGELKLSFDKEKGEFSIFYYQHKFPVNPSEYARILGLDLDRLTEELGAENSELLELQSLIAAFSHLPARTETATEQRTERMRDKEIHKRRLATLCTNSSPTTEFIDENVKHINGTPSDPKSFNDLHNLIKAQAYRLAYWRVAADDVNYRRFFDINDLAGLRMENDAVFEITHRFVLELVRQGKVDGLRIDHPDGLYDPGQYFQRLQWRGSDTSDKSCGSKSLYVVIEKILTGDEQLPKEWPVHGTTGYDFMNLVNGLFIDPAAAGRMSRMYRNFVERPINFDNQLYRSKKIVMHAALASELNVLANALNRIALSDRHTCDFTVNSLRDAISRIVACFPVYRTYISEDHLSEADQAYTEQAVERAKHLSAGSDASVFDFARDVLLAPRLEGQGAVFRKAAIRFAMKFQQFTSAVMAKGMEDTSFYRYHRLISLNEVGGDPRRFGVPTEVFHRKIQEQAKLWPHSMLDTSSHDTKRSEDVRARINVLSEIPVLWRKRVRRWRELNLDKKSVVADVEAPSRNDEYLLYQTLVGAWPLEAERTTHPPFCERVTQYMLKAVREAKEKTSWANPNVVYEEAVTKFVKALLTSSGADQFLADFVPFQQQVARIGMFNSLSQTLIKLTSPGVPDIYQGNELWNFSLVDPDNRHPVDYARRQHLLQEFQPLYKKSCDHLKSKVRQLNENMSDGRIKLYLTWKTLTLRKQRPVLFQEGDYLPLSIHGEKANHLIAFARQDGNSVAIVAVPRLCAQLLADGATSPLDPTVWNDTRVELPFANQTPCYQNAFTLESVMPERSGQALFVRASELFANFPVALLTLEQIKARPISTVPTSSSSNIR
jgi:(1->4)-alpha-D-glucan 1-alpha-D-glucosylmutase